MRYLIKKKKINLRTNKFLKAELIRPTKIYVKELTRVNEKNLMLPLNFGAKGSAQIGGIVSTNAGGLRVLRFGMTRNLILGVEAVLSNGEIISSMKKITKDNSGYDIKQLFIGSEGTLGIISKVIFKLEEKPSSRFSALAGLTNYENVINFLKFMCKSIFYSVRKKNRFYLIF